ncbi:hypothetical protein [Escherichia coli]
MTDITELALIAKIKKQLENFDTVVLKEDEANALVEALEKAQQRIDELDLFRTAFMEWSDKTDWVQTDKRFDVLKPWGKHRADVLKEYIQHLESRSVTVKPPKLKMLEDYLAEVAIEERKQILVGVKLEFHRACVAAGIKVEDE